MVKKFVARNIVKIGCPEHVAITRDFVKHSSKSNCDFSIGRHQNTVASKCGAWVFNTNAKQQALAMWPSAALFTHALITRDYETLFCVCGPVFLMNGMAVTFLGEYGRGGLFYTRNIDTMRIANLERETWKEMKTK